MTKFLFFDNAATTPCLGDVAEVFNRFSCEDYGNPSSSHALGQEAAKAIRDSRQFFAQAFRVEPSQVIFTGSGTEADNLAIYGVALPALARPESRRKRVLASSIDHPAVRKTVLSLGSLGLDAQLIPVDAQGQVRGDELDRLVGPETLLVSIHQVNNIMGAILPVAELAQLAKQKNPGLVFHTDSVQAFGKVAPPDPRSGVDLVSISGHKVHGPKGVGALIILNKNLLKHGLRPLIWGGEQEGGFRSGTQNAGLIAGFRVAAERTLAEQAKGSEQVHKLQTRFRDLLIIKGLLANGPRPGGKVHWNSPSTAVPHIVSLSVPGYPAALLAKLLEERRCLVSTGSACSSQKIEPDQVLIAMGVPGELCQSAIRVSFSSQNELDEVDQLVAALDESIQMMTRLLRPTR